MVVLDATATGWRLLRAAGFVLVAAVLGVAGHLQVSATAVSPWLLVAVSLPVAFVGWRLSAGEPGTGTLGGCVVGVQLGLHLVLTLSAPTAGISPAAAAGMTGMHSMAGASAIGGMGLGPMAAAHLCSAALAAWWIRRGERALFTTVRAGVAVRRLAAAFWFRLAAQPAVTATDEGIRPVPSTGQPWLHSLVSVVCSVKRRGPPAALAG